MPEDPDTNVVKIAVDEEGCIPLILGQNVAEVAAGLGIEQFPTAFGRVADGVCLSHDEMVNDRMIGIARFHGLSTKTSILYLRTDRLILASAANLPEDRYLFTRRDI
jgi:hypothetical protein